MSVLTIDIRSAHAVLDSFDVRAASSPRSWQRRFHDVPWIRQRDLRHTHATLLLEAGVQPKVVQERLGHQTIQITMDLYSHVMPTVQRAAVDAFANLLA